MTITQIMALLSLLLAFGVDGPTYHKVEAILMAQQSVTISPMKDQIEPSEEVVAPEEKKPAETDVPKKVDRFNYSGSTY